MKKLLALMLAVLTVVALAACGGTPAANDGSSAANDGADKSPAASGYTAGNTEFFIGGTGPLTGDASSYGISVQEGATLAIEEINAAGGLNGKTFKFDMKDDKAGAPDAATGYDMLYEAGMQISIGSVTSGSCASFASKSLEDNLFFITPSASAANVIATGDNGFRICFGDPQQGELAAKEFKARGYENIGCIYDTSDPYSAGIYEAFEAEMKELGLEYTVRTFDNDNKKDFSTQVEALKACDVIFLPFYYTEAGLVAKAAVAKDCTADLFGCDGLDGVKGQIDETVTAHNKVEYITPFDVDSDDEFTAAFVKNYEAKYGRKPDQFAADGYDAIYTIVKAMEAAGIDDVTIAPDELCEKVKAVITSADFSVKGATGTMQWEANGSCNKAPQIVEVKF